ncbi:MAG: Asp-tRNA(Asn)/Glu-tRNA(Gln) amidotransferase subunit GatB [Polyangia bacterium]
MAPVYEPVIGLECHVQLGTISKAFTGASATFGAAPNHHTDPYTLALPGTLPVLSRATVEYAIRMGLANQCRIRPLSRFARKHYFYPDLPKGYQISQYDEPLCEGGRVQFLLGGELRQARLTRIHVEEDAGKSTHLAGTPHSLVDYNRAGVPLIEVVSEPELRSAEEAGAYLRAIRQLVRWLGISDGNMEEGSLRCDANVSLRPVGESRLGTKTELKNINSFKNVEAAIGFEIARQTEVLERGGRVVQETRLWNPDKNSSYPMRSKEEAHDYRYFPEPDLPPLHVDEAWIERVRTALPELPLARRQRYLDALGLTPYDASVLTAERPIADYFEQVIAGGLDVKTCAHFISGELLGRLNRDNQSIAESPIAPAALAELLALVTDGTISGKIAKDVFEKMWTSGRAAREIVAAEGLTQLTDAGAIEAACRTAIEANPKQLAQYRAGNAKLVGFFVGQVMKATQGKANPELVNRLLAKLLDEK